MKEIDEQIREALQAQQDELNDGYNLDNEGILQMFRGHSKWITITWFSLMAVTVTVMIVSAVQFFRVESTRAMIAWATGFTVCFIFEALIEFSFLADCRKNALQCQIKRLELQVATLVSGMENKEEQPEDEKA
ncbi:DUF6768 family protein [Gimesia aquarii]|uniref:Uncharacterized protein n=1 Tax=Gimesia aquarii TaxID=2527964 RepID=A0A517VZE8_9PLAN|nr:DUF6768 family protein [Gimesia aquarii]QDT98377.1 hypothetical protein V144x_38630 [Gimesia aquarii]